MRRTPTGCRCSCRITAIPYATATSGSASYASTSDRMMRRAVFVVVTAAGLMAAPLTAQVPAQATDMLRRLFASREFAPEHFGPARWIAGGTAYTTVEPASDNTGSDIVRYETATGARGVAVAARQLIPPGATASLDIDDYEWSSDASKLLIFTNTQRVWRQNTRGDYWVLDRAGRTLKKLGGDAPASPPPSRARRPGPRPPPAPAGVVGADGGAPRWLRVPDDPRQNSLPRLEWAGPQELVLQRINRAQNTDRVMLADATTGAVRTVLVERDSAWLDVVDDLQWLAGGKEFTWVSERDGWRHVYRVSRDGKTVRLVTPGAFDVIEVAALDEPGGWLYYIASPDNATQRYLYRIPLDGSGKPERVTPADRPGTHSYDISPDARWAWHTSSTLDTPPVTDLVRLPSHATARTVVGNEQLSGAVAPLTSRRGEFFRVPLPDSATLDGWMIRPRDFDSTRTYPLLMYVYGEPAGQTARDQWMGGLGLWFRMLADQGYVVASVDNRGTPAPRGRAWRKVVYGAIGVLSSREQADAVRALTRSRRYLDATRVGIWGWSGGGSSTLQAMFRYPDVYQVGMSVAPVPDERLYDTIYQERYMGLPQDNKSGYETASAISHAEGLRGRLLLVHGSGDDNVHYQGSERLLNRLVALGKPVDFMEYPNRSHCICEGQGTTLHVYSLLTRYLIEHLPAGPPTRAGT